MKRLAPLSLAWRWWAAAALLALAPSVALADRPHTMHARGAAPPLYSTAAPISCGPHYVDCGAGRCQPGPWDGISPFPWEVYVQGTYVGHERTAHVPQYRLRVDDRLEFVYRLTRDEIATPYELNVGDEIRVESFADPNLNREQLVVQPDGTITLRLLGQVRATRRTVAELRDELERLYAAFYKEPAITVTPTKVNTRLEDLRATVDGRYGAGGQTRFARVTPDGTVALPAVGSVPVQGLTLDEVKAELDARYADKVLGIEVTPVLVERAPRHVFVLGEVGAPGRYVLEGPTTLTQAIALAGGWNIGGDLRQVVVFRRADDWRLLAAKVDLWDALYTVKQPCPCGEIWLNDSDVVLVPKMGILRCDEWIDLIFTHGIYGVVPFQGVSINMAKLSSL
jgi:polysaccharide export outer membrane protein